VAAKPLFRNITTRMRMLPKWLRKHDTLYLGLLALLVGVLAGYGALFLRFGIEWASRIWTG